MIALVFVGLEQVDPAAGCEAGVTEPVGGAPPPARRRAPTPGGCPVKGPEGDDSEFTGWF